MIVKQPKQNLLCIAALFAITVLANSCSNSADSSKTTTDSAKVVTDTTKAMVDSTSKMKADTAKMDTAATRPIKTPNN